MHQDIFAQQTEDSLMISINSAPKTPRSFKCPLTGQTFQSPTLEADGYTYEKEALDTWDATHSGISPTTRLPLLPFPREPNTTLARTMREFYEQRTGPAGMANEWQKNLECLVTRETMHDPVRLSDGRDYSQQGARDLVNFHGRSPYTNQVFTTEWLRPNRTLAALAREALGTPVAVYPEHLERTGPDLADAVEAYINAGLRRNRPHALQNGPLRLEVIAACGRQFEQKAVVAEETFRGIMRMEGEWRGLRILVGHLPRLSVVPRYMRHYYDAADALEDLRHLADMLLVNGALDERIKRHLTEFDNFLTPRMNCWKRQDGPYITPFSAVCAIGVGLAFGQIPPAARGIAPMLMLFGGVWLGSNLFACALALTERRYPSNFLGEPAPPQVWDKFAKVPQWPKTVARRAFYAGHAALVGGGYGALFSLRFADPQRIAPFMVLAGAFWGSAGSVLFFGAQSAGRFFANAAAAERAA